MAELVKPCLEFKWNYLMLIHYGVDQRYSVSEISDENSHMTESRLERRQRIQSFIKKRKHVHLITLGLFGN